MKSSSLKDLNWKMFKIELKAKSSFLLKMLISYWMPMRLEGAPWRSCRPGRFSVGWLRCHPTCCLGWRTSHPGCPALPPHYGWLGDGHHTNIYISYTNQLYASNIQLERKRRRRKILQQSKVSDRQRGGGIQLEEEEEDEGIYSRGYKAMMKLKDKTEGGCFFDLKRKEPPPPSPKEKNPKNLLKIFEMFDCWAEDGGRRKV